MFIFAHKYIRSDSSRQVHIGSFVLIIWKFGFDCLQLSSQIL